MTPIIIHFHIHGNFIAGDTFDVHDNPSARGDSTSEEQGGCVP